MDMCYELSKCSACFLLYNFHYIELLGQRRKQRQRISPPNWFVANPGFKTNKCLFVCIKVSAFPDGYHLTKYAHWKLRGNSLSWEGICWALLSFIFFDSGIAATAISSGCPQLWPLPLLSAEKELITWVPKVGWDFENAASTQVEGENTNVFRFYKRSKTENIHYEIWDGSLASESSSRSKGKSILESGPAMKSFLTPLPAEGP